MTCSRSQDLDLAAYLVDPADSEWDDFRAHYPTCSDCSLAVESWTKLERALRGGAPEGAGGPHPEPALLEAFDSGPNALPAEQWQTIDVHLQGCHRCADELASLRSFDLAGLAASAPPRRVEALRDLGRALGEGVRALAGQAREVADDVAASLGPEAAVAVQSAGHRVGSRVPVAVLVALGELSGEVLTLFEGEWSVGRGVECALRVEHDSMPRVAATFEVEAGRCTLTAVAARPPVLVNGDPVERAELRDGDHVMLGTEVFELRFVGRP
ncbi:MAG: FHA domain-containing protein [Myxococcota bacterium]